MSVCGKFAPGRIEQKSPKSKPLVRGRNIKLEHLAGEGRRSCAVSTETDVSSNFPRKLKDEQS